MYTDTTTLYEMMTVNREPSLEPQRIQMDQYQQNMQIYLKSHGHGQSFPCEQRRYIHCSLVTHACPCVQGYCVRACIPAYLIINPERMWILLPTRIDERKCDLYSYSFSCP